MKTEKVIGVLVLLGMLMKLFHFPFSGPLLTLSLSTLSLLYFPFGFYFLNENFKIRNMVLSGLGGFLICSAPLGILFKLMHWPSADQMLIVGGTSCVLLFVIVLVVKKINSSAIEEVKKVETGFQKNLLEEEIIIENNDLFYKNMFIRTSALFSLTILLFIIT